ncbi:MAG: hypothetical protein Q9214_004395 [Letrouitia sp. 1 TL-2023]
MTDPIWYLVHGEYDKLWWEWQEVNRKRLKDYGGRFMDGATEKVASLDDQLRFGGLSPDINMDKLPQPAGVLLVGSVPLASAEAVFTKSCSALPQRLQAIPDGETGIRSRYVGWQRESFPKETIRFLWGGTQQSSSTSAQYTIESVAPTRYDDVAIQSYEKLIKLRNQGLVPRDVRFQVSLPSPFSVIQGNIRPEFQMSLEPLYEQHFKDSLLRIVNEISNEDLAIQWDLCFDVIALEFDRRGMAEAPQLPGEQWKAQFSPVKQGILDRLVEVCTLVPPAVSMGFHLCYGDFRHRHIVEPIDLSLLVDLANSIFSRTGKRHKQVWFHMPVPKDRKDEAYFAPLRDLRLGENGRLYLGLVHANDEVGTHERILAAQSIYKRAFGVATECGLGRTPEEEIDGIFEICKTVTEPSVQD